MKTNYCKLAWMLLQSYQLSVCLVLYFDEVLEWDCNSNFFFMKKQQCSEKHSVIPKFETVDI